MKLTAARWNMNKQQSVLNLHDLMVYDNQQVEPSVSRCFKGSVIIPVPCVIQPHGIRMQLLMLHNNNTTNPPDSDFTPEQNSWKESTSGQAICTFIWLTTTLWCSWYGKSSCFVYVGNSRQLGNWWLPFVLHDILLSTCFPFVKSLIKGYGR